MKKILVLSGKGGTGKTTLSSALIHFLKAKNFADCDVDAPNLHLLIKEKENPRKTPYFGSQKAWIEKDLCNGCEVCMEHCKFHAIYKKNSRILINEFLCEGCGVCQYVCPQNAVNLKKDEAGTLLQYEGEHFFSSAQLKVGRGNSGKLVSQVKMALNQSHVESEYTIIDGSPGIGCPVIASVSGVDLVIAVTEPSLSGFSDLKRLFYTVSSFQIPMAVCVNKYNLSIQNTEEIEKYCEEEEIYFLGKIPYDKTVIEALNEGKSVIEYDCPSKIALKHIYENVTKIL